MAKSRRWGYTTAAHRASYYSEDEAREIVDRANIWRPGLRGSWCQRRTRCSPRWTFGKENTILFGHAQGRDLLLRNPAAHVVEQMIPIDEPQVEPSALRTFLAMTTPPRSWDLRLGCHGKRTAPD